MNLPLLWVIDDHRTCRSAVIGRWLGDVMAAIPPAVAYLVVAVVATAESLFLGLVLPGELVLVLAGLLAFHGRVSLTGRLVGVLRAVMPMAAGMARMRYRTFATYAATIRRETGPRASPAATSATTTADAATDRDLPTPSSADT